MWEVTGGADKGGILVREGQGLSSKACDERLSTGATVKELQLVGDRLRYELITGTGPSTGWVSVKISGKELLKPQKPEALPEVVLPDFEQLEDGYPTMAKGTRATGTTPWLKKLGKANPDVKARLVIFSWTGNRGGQGSAHNFQRAPGKWSEILKDWEQLEVNYPGRGTRMKDPLYEDCDAYVKDIAAALQEALKDGLPVVFLGFSFGAILAMEAARRLQSMDLGPLGIVVASAEGPTWPGRNTLGLAELNEAKFEQMLHDKGGTDFILKDPGMKKMFVPVITADCKLEEKYRFDLSLGPLKCPLLVFHGTKEGHDKMKTLVSPESLTSWLQISTCRKRSKIQALDCDWYIFQDAASMDLVASTLVDFFSV